MTSLQQQAPIPSPAPQLAHFIFLLSRICNIIPYNSFVTQSFGMTWTTKNNQYRKLAHVFFILNAIVTCMIWVSAGGTRFSTKMSRTHTSHSILNLSLKHCLPVKKATHVCIFACRWFCYLHYALHVHISMNQKKNANAPNTQTFNFWVHLIYS